MQALCPGFTYTGFHDTSELVDDFDRTRIPRMLWMSAEQVVAGSLKGLGRGGVVYIPGIRNRLLAAVSKSKIVSLIFRSVLKGRGHTDGRD